MAKGLRSSVKKSNRTKLRARVFQPVEDARLERLHQKLLETAQQPKPETAKDKEMDVDSTEDAAAHDASKEEDFPKDMDVDGESARSKSKPKDRKAIRKARMERRKKPKNQIRFPTTRGKGALKPFSESRVRKRRS
ncbi:hypothetical protein N0V90_001993 [Kalmusia sp. IMI 367209]|nr:hypothetical protein N0V90_001993 [Kalmusia sp. IMI 367209]